MKQSLRILQVNSHDIFGGAEGSTTNLFRAYRSKGHASWLAVGYKYSNDPDIFLFRNDRTRNLWARFWWLMDAQLQPYIGRIRGLGRVTSLARWLAQPQAWIDTYRGIENFNAPGAWHLLDLTPQRPDIVHCHNLHGQYFDLRALPWLSSQVPVILNLRDAWLLSGHCAHSFDCERWKIGCGQCPYLKIYPPVRRDATAYNWQRKADIYAQSRLYITAPSEWLMNKVQQSMLKGVQYRVIPNAIDLAVFKPGDQIAARRELGLPHPASVVLFTAHNMFKDYRVMEMALERLPKPDSAPLIFVCLGKKQADRAVGAGRMVYPGFERNPQRMALYYRAADVFIHAAKDEAFGKTVTEAMACGTPVVATRVGGIVEQIEHERTGFLVPPGDSQAMTAAITRVFIQSQLRETVRRAGIVEVGQRFSLERQVQNFLDWYQEILEDWQKSAPVVVNQHGHSTGKLV